MFGILHEINIVVLSLTVSQQSVVVGYYRVDFVRRMLHLIMAFDCGQL